MKVNEFKKLLEGYNDDAEVIGVDYTNGNEFDVTVGSDDEDEGDKYCIISFV